jgi:hypothetical protein
VCHRRGPRSWEQKYAWKGGEYSYSQELRQKLAHARRLNSAKRVELKGRDCDVLLVAGEAAAAAALAIERRVAGIMLEVCVTLEQERW